MDILGWLEEWYTSNCDGYWEHVYNNVSITTLDNPGWRVRINVSETIHEDTVFNKISIERTDNDWIFCEKKEGSISCAGGSRNLKEILEIIRKWMDDNKPA